METPPSSPRPDILHSSAVVKPLKPLIYNFFVSDHPEGQQQTLQEINGDHYRSFQSQKLEMRNTHFFRPTMQFKKLVDEPKFLLSVQRRKIKIMNGICQKASSEKPSRSSYRGKKLRNTVKTITPEDVEQPELESRDRRIESQQPTRQSSTRKTKQPHLHFNLRFMLQTRKTFKREFSQEGNITGSNFPYYNYFSSTKSSVPNSDRKVGRYKTPQKAFLPHTAHDLSPRIAKTSQKKRIISTTVQVRTKPFIQIF